MDYDRYSFRMPQPNPEYGSDGDPAYSCYLNAVCTMLDGSQLELCCGDYATVGWVCAQVGKWKDLPDVHVQLWRGPTPLTNPYLNIHSLMDG